MVKRLIFEGDIPFHPTAKGSYHTGHGLIANVTFDATVVR